MTFLVVWVQGCVYYLGLLVLLDFKLDRLHILDLEW